jgi:hypothetical protein
MEICVAYPAGLCFDQDLARAARGNINLLKDQSLSELFDNCGVHLAGHENFLPGRTMNFGIRG